MLARMGANVTFCGVCVGARKLDTLSGDTGPKRARFEETTRGGSYGTWTLLAHVGAYGRSSYSAELHVQL